MTKGEFDQFCTRHREGMYHTANLILMDVQRAENAVLEVFTRTCRIYHALNFGSECEEEVFALLAAQNAAIDLMRESRLSRTGSGDRLPAGVISIYGGAVAVTKAERVAQLVGQLPLRQKSVLRYRNMGLSFEEIATSLNIDVELARTLAHQSRTQIADQLEKEGFHFD